VLISNGHKDLFINIDKLIHRLEISMGRQLNRVRIFRNKLITLQIGPHFHQ
jgi:hypothetical protein